MPDWMREKLGFLELASENRSAFFDRIAEIYPSSDPRYRLIERAYDTAKSAFRDVLRDDGQRYFEHLRAVALIAIVHLRMRNANVIAAILLHDIVEDVKGWSVERIAREFNDEVAAYVWWVTKPPLDKYGSKEEAERKYHRNLRAAPRMSVLIKVCDRLHNLMNIWQQAAERIARKVAETRDFVLPLAEEHQLLIHELEDVLRMLESGASAEEKEATC